MLQCEMGSRPLTGGSGYTWTQLCTNEAGVGEDEPKEWFFRKRKKKQKKLFGEKYIYISITFEWKVNFLEQCTYLFVAVFLFLQVTVYRTYNSGGAASGWVGRVLLNLDMQGSGFQHMTANWPCQNGDGTPFRVTYRSRMNCPIVPFTEAFPSLRCTNGGKMKLHVGFGCHYLTWLLLLCDDSCAAHLLYWHYPGGTAQEHFLLI